MSPLCKPGRRRFIQAASLLGLNLAAPGMSGALAKSAPQTVTVVTSYADEFVSHIEAAFEKAYPQYRLRVVWRMPNDAAPYLQQPDHGGADVYWSASPRTFARLARDNTWRKLPIDSGALPHQVGKTELSDAAGFYTASEIAGFGFAVSPPALAQRGLPLPADWTDLTDPRLAGLIALPVPARVGFAPPMVEIVLQAYGWQRGWALWSEIAANAKPIERGSTFVTDEVAAGRCAIGLSIDFFVNSAIANGAALSFIYPRHTGLNPAHVAVTRHSSNPEGAATFVNFLLSLNGQKLLAHPDIRRLPIRPDAYAGLPASQFNPFAAAAEGGLQFDSDAARPRLATTASLFQQMLIEPLAELTPLWRRLQAAEQAGKPLPKVRQLLGAPPIDEAAANDPALQRAIGLRLEGENPAIPTPQELAWGETAARNRRTARQLLDEAGA